MTLNYRPVQRTPPRRYLEKGGYIDITLHYITMRCTGSPVAFSTLIKLLRTFRGHPFMMSTRRGGGVRLRWTHVDGGSQAPCGRLHRKLKLESTDVILSSSHAKKLASFFTGISSLDGITSENFSAT